MPLLVEMALERVASGGADDELVEDVPPVGRLGRQGDATLEPGVAEQTAVARRVDSPRLGPAARCGALTRSTAACSASIRKLRADQRGGSTSAPCRGCAAAGRALASAGVVGREQPGVAEGAEVLARKEREAAERADAADRPRLVGRADRLRGVFDDRDAGARRPRRESDRDRRSARTGAPAGSPWSAA